MECYMMARQSLISMQVHDLSNEGWWDGGGGVRGCTGRVQQTRAIFLESAMTDSLLQLNLTIILE